MERNKLRIGERGADRYPWGVCMWQVGCGVTVTRLCWPVGLGGNMRKRSFGKVL